MKIACTYYPKALYIYYNNSLTYHATEPPRCSESTNAGEKFSRWIKS
jgi:hypothetical protein